MGTLIIDQGEDRKFRGSYGKRSKDKRTCEWDTTTCPHCQAVILVDCSNGVRKYDTRYRCFRCGNKPICRHCGEKNQGICTPFGAQVDAALKQPQNGMTAIVYQYQAVTKR